MKRFLAGLALSVSLLGVVSPAWAGHCPKAADSHRDLQECVAHEITQNDDELSIWIPAVGVAIVVGAGLSLFFLRRNALPQNFPRSEDEAWAEVLGPEAGA